MHIRTMLMIICLSIASAQAMQKKIINWFEDPTPHIAIVSLDTNRNFYSEDWDRERRWFPEVVIEKNTPIALVILFTAKNKRAIKHYKQDRYAHLVKDNGISPMASMRYVPITIIGSWKEGDRVMISHQNGKDFVICDQKAIGKVTFQEEVESLKKFKDL